jgi:hypothetical protein
MKPELFIGSSVEGLNITEAIEQDLQHRFIVTSWKSGVFNLGSNALDDLLEQLSKSDFGIFVFTADDITKIRAKAYSTVRDNVLYELGLYTGKLGRRNTFIIKPSTTPEEFHLPTDLIGISIGTFDVTRDNKNAAVSPFCGQIKSQVFNSDKYIFNGKWRLTWEVKNSKNYPEQITDDVEVFHYDDKIKFLHTISENEKYLFTGTFKNPYFTGIWESANKVSYDGVFQLKLNGKGGKFEGIWSGWTNSGGINSGPCFLEKA